MSNDEIGFGAARTSDRGWDEVLADAVRVLTEAARLRRPVLRQAEGGGWEPDPLQTELADWAEFITLAVAGAAANIGSIDRALEGRPGSWEADAVRSLLVSTVGHDSAHLLEHRTEPILVTLRPAEILSDLGYAALYDESRQVLQVRAGPAHVAVPPGRGPDVDAARSRRTRLGRCLRRPRGPGRARRHAAAPGHRHDGAPVRGRRSRL